MRILYGVVGEGMGHATRSRVVIEHLLAQGHEVEIMVSGRAHDMLRKHFKDVHRVHGWHLVYEDNAVKKTRTALSNLLDLAKDAPLLEKAYRQLDDFRPEVVISDFESWTYMYAQAHHLPVISIDNMQIINRCQHESEVTGGLTSGFLLAKGIVKAKLPGCHHYVITTFFTPPVHKERTTLVPPILRPEVLAATPGDDEDHVLVYVSTDSAESLQAVLRQLPDQEFLVYGLRRGIAEEQVDGNLRHQPFSETRFVEHLASAQAVIAGGGFSLMGECVYLQKPMLSVPLAGQFEQVLNARYLEKLGYGLCRETIDLDDVQELLARRGEFAANLATYVQDGNVRLFEVVDALLAAILSPPR